ncbi:hybrid sensor histidine kinase/response regulator [Microvirga splendida]|uniref:histidine kinase n=1 Tax=Microvirga splendida TaxID=2795727 RepID=A0ABS0XUQ2_9HYPH|nr:ATP-binding protein [Microvirga splendida]MBJ6123776.1 response regulator [Microvirga splendida]
MRRDTKLRRLHHSSLFWRFILIGIAVLAPLIGALVQLAGEERAMAVEATRKRAELLISYAVESQDHVLDEAKAILHFLADAEEVRSAGAECRMFLSRYMRLHRWVTGLRYSDAAGNEICSDRMGGAESFDGREFLQGVVQQGNGFALSDLVVEPSTGALRMTAAAPVMQDGRIIGTVSAEINPGVFEERSHIQVDPDLDVTMFIVDRKGTLVAHHPPLDSLIGATLTEIPVIQKAMQAPREASEYPDLAGTPRLFAFRELPGTGAVLAMGIHRDSVVTPIEVALRYRLVLITLVVGGSLLLGMLGAESFFFRPLRGLVHTAEAFEYGDFGSRAPRRGAGEVRILARALNRMADAVAERENELRAARKMAEEALSRANTANQAKTDFLASMSHEIRTPLNGIIGYTERLLEETLPPRQHRYAELIQVSASALLTVANDVLDFSSIEAGQIKLQLEPFSIVSLVDNTVSIVSSGAETKGVPIQIDMDRNLPAILLGDEARLRQILLNLLNNAVKFTREGHITARVEHKGRSEAGEVVRISVIDTGIGIPLEKQGRLFKRFSQVDPSIRREFGGTGLGLAISRHLVELMGGQIGVESHEGKGSVFWIEIAMPQADAPSIRPSRADALPIVAPSRILLAEDIEINQELVRTLLNEAGHDVDVVSSGAEAVAAVQAKVYDVVLMDIQMPGMDGITAMREIRALKSPARRVFIVATTANVLPQQVRGLRKAGFDDHIGKPIRRADLLAKLSEWRPMQGRAVPAQDAKNRSRSHCDQGGFEEFRAMFGDERAGQWLDRLDRQLRSSFAGPDADALERDQVAKEAHAVISQAALLGFPELADLCASLEQACLGGGDIAVPLEKVCCETLQVRERIAGMKRLVSV